MRGSITLPRRSVVRWSLDKTGVEVAAEILAKYVGIYEGPYLGGPRTIGVSFSGGSLFVSRNEGSKHRSCRSRKPASLQRKN